MQPSRFQPLTNWQMIIITRQLPTKLPCHSKFLLTWFKNDLYSKSSISTIIDGLNLVSAGFVIEGLVTS